MKVIGTERLPIKMWLDELEDGALAQAKNLANLPFAFRHVAIMPDSHQGYGMPIGGVLATKGTIVPNAVGVDIGCGMCAVQTSMTSIDRHMLMRVVNRIKELVPVGFNWHKEPQIGFMPTLPLSAYAPVIHGQYEKAQLQVGTLGGGNHFIEIQKGSDGFIWIMVHSGSRNLGKQVADHYNKMAVALNERWFSSVPGEWQLAFLPIDAQEARQYRTEMEYCVQFALANRRLMLSFIMDSFEENLSAVEFADPINIAHNYAAMENHYGENVMVHRKGATQAREGQTGIIPGSQGTKSYIVRGKGNRESFMSCSHGAGRKMGRKQATRQLDLAEQQALMDSKGIIHSIASVKDLDEAPAAYKDIDVVMQNQADLVEIVVELTPLAVIKATEA